MKKLIAIFMVLLATGCATTSAPAYYDPMAMQMMEYGIQMMMPQYQYRGNPYFGNGGGNPYIRPAGITNCMQTGNMINCNSF